MYCIYNKLRSQPLWLRAYNREISNSLSSLLLVGPQEWNPPLKLRGAGNCKCSFLLLKALWLVGFWINFKDSLDLNFELIPGSLSKERKNAASGFGEDSWQPLFPYARNICFVIISACLGHNMGEHSRCINVGSSCMEQMAVSLELSYSKINAGTVPIYQRLFLTPMDAKQVCPVIFLRQIPPVQRDPETVLLKQAKTKWPKWLSICIRYMEIIKIAHLGPTSPLWLFLFWAGEIRDIPAILESHWLSLHWRDMKAGRPCLLGVVSPKARSPMAVALGPRFSWRLGMGGVFWKTYVRHRLIRICCRVELWGTLIYTQYHLVYDYAVSSWEQET